MARAKQFIDIHAHAYWKPSRAPYITKFYSTTQLLEAYDYYGIEKGALLPIVNPEVYLPQTNEDILDMAAAYPDRFIPFCNIDPRSVKNDPTAPMDQVFQYYKDLGCKGIGEVMPNLEVMDPKVQNLFRCAEKVGLSVTYDGAAYKDNCFGLYDDPGLPQLEATLQKCPNLIILGHGPVFWSEIGKLDTLGVRGPVRGFNHYSVLRLPEGPIKEEGVMPKLLRKYPNLHLDLSDGTAYNALTRDPEYGPAFLEEFQDRAYFGTDLCSVGMEVPLVDTLWQWKDEGRISMEAFEKISRENAIRLLKL